MPENNFMIFNEAFKEIDTMNDSEYQAATQRQKGVASGVADRRLHNKFYRQASTLENQSPKESTKANAPGVRIIKIIFNPILR